MQGARDSGSTLRPRSPHNSNKAALAASCALFEHKLRDRQAAARSPTPSAQMPHAAAAHSETGSALPPGASTSLPVMPAAGLSLAICAPAPATPPISNSASSAAAGQSLLLTAAVAPPQSESPVQQASAELLSAAAAEFPSSQQQSSVRASVPAAVVSAAPSSVSSAAALLQLSASSAAEPESVGGASAAAAAAVGESPSAATNRPLCVQRQYIQQKLDIEEHSLLLGLLLEHDWEVYCASSQKANRERVDQPKRVFDKKDRSTFIVAQAATTAHVCPQLTPDTGTRTGQAAWRHWAAHAPCRGLSVCLCRTNAFWAS